MISFNYAQNTSLLQLSASFFDGTLALNKISSIKGQTDFVFFP